MHYMIVFLLFWRFLSLSISWLSSPACPTAPGHSLALHCLYIGGSCCFSDLPWQSELFAESSDYKENPVLLQFYICILLNLICTEWEVHVPTVVNRLKVGSGGVETSEVLIEQPLSVKPKAQQTTAENKEGKSLIMLHQVRAAIHSVWFACDGSNYTNKSQLISFSSIDLF